MNMIESTGEMCKLIGSIPHTAISWVWFLIANTFSNYWHFIIPALVVWIGYQFIFRHNHYYNSENGFTPLFNSFIGGGVFYLTQALIDFVLNLFGGVTSCATLWISSFHLIPFVLTGIFLFSIGFWSYIKDPFTKKKLRRR